MDKKQIKELIERTRREREVHSLHEPYKERFNRTPDFQVKYEFFPELQDELSFTQGARCDFLYDGDDPAIDGIHMIWPEFLSEKGDVILDKSYTPEFSGTANMWIVDENRKSYHSNRLEVGTKGYFIVGSKKLARVTVTKLFE